MTQKSLQKMPDLAKCAELLTIHASREGQHYYDRTINMCDRVEHLLPVLNLIQEHDVEVRSVDGNFYQLSLNGLPRVGHYITVKKNDYNEEIEVTFDYLHTRYRGMETFKKLLKLKKRVGEGFRYLSDRCVHKYLKGHFKVDEEEYLNMLASQSLTNMMKDAEKRSRR